MLQHAPRACPSPDRDGFGPGGAGLRRFRANGIARLWRRMGLSSHFELVVHEDPSEPERQATDYLAAWSGSSH